jgi:hypothetical protein
MHEWVKWKKSKSPPLLGYPNLAWEKAHGQGPIATVNKGPHAGPEVEINKLGLMGGAPSVVISIASKDAQGDDVQSETSSSLSLLPTAPAPTHANSLKHLVIMGGGVLYVLG